jgi:F-type H+-transporting ATPase subunit b
MLELLLLLALVILGVVIYKTGAHKIITDMLDNHAKKVRSELNEARQLREEAQILLAEHQRKLSKGEDHARKIVEHAEAEARRMLERHESELQACLKRREEQAMARIAREEAKALQDVRERTARLAIRTTGRLLADKVTGEKGKSLLDDAIEEVSRKFA